jgi:hypothetical protein
MGQAKKRGTFEDRKAEAIERDAKRWAKQKEESAKRQQGPEQIVRTFRHEGKETRIAIDGGSRSRSARTALLVASIVAAAGMVAIDK